MRLKYIKLVGFKSFVDPTKVPFPDQMTCVVGPNGCGKSNVIDAVRWVLGESSAKNLRGDAMTDVIFNGSSSRKPVSQASVELVFDNESGRIQGEFASFKEISVKRQVTRDGQSNYFLNGSKCRRRDITDLFLGTGLGPRSYAIIEQGMISRLIESKPQELRVFIEEAAGISKYKERRRETESRIGHTRENLERISDVREELGQQLEKLQRQATAATRYKALKSEERRLKDELHAVRWLKLEQQRQTLTHQQQQQKTELARWQAEQTGDERGVIERREQAAQLKQVVDDKQQQLFTLSNQITRLEQNLQHQQQLHQQRLQRRQQLQRELDELQQQSQEDDDDQRQLQEQIEALQPSAEEAQEQLLELEEKMTAAQQQCEAARMARQQVEQEQQQLQQQYQQQQLQQQRLQQQISYIERQLEQLELTQFEEALTTATVERDKYQQKLRETEQAQQQAALTFQQLEQQVAEARQHSAQTAETLSTLQQQQHQMQARQEALQQMLEGQQRDLSDSAKQWLRQHQAQPVREVLQVDPDWQQAIERIMAPWLDAYWLKEIPEQPVPDGVSVLWPSQQLTKRSSVGRFANASSIVKGELHDWPWFARCLLVTDVTEAYQALAADAEALLAVTRQGYWFSRWSAEQQPVAEQQGILAMQQESQQLNQRLELLQQEIRQAQHEKADWQQRVSDSEAQQRQQQQQLQQLNTDVVKAEQQQHYAAQQLQQLQQQQQKMAAEQEQAQQQRQQLQAQLTDVDEAMRATEQQLEQLPQNDHAEYEHYERRLRELQQQQQQLQSKRQQLLLEQQHLQNQLQQQQKLQHRHNQRQHALKDELETLAEALTDAEDQEIQREQLQVLLEQRQQQSELLTEQRDALAEIEHELHELSQGNSALKDKITQAQQQLQQTEIELAKLQERTQTVLDALADSNANLKTILDNLSQQADESSWQRKLDDVQNKIKRLGAINLAAIDEAETQKQRKDYLDQQFDDLSSALETLEEAIKKIDRETRQRFKTTFDAVNQDLQILFPKVFGGGTAKLELTDDDLLETGVAIMAQPPGKKNSTIHLLSGGEKALTALSLVFAIFRLNPAPFCLLDEVDAPLDDANVGRFCRLVSEMSESVQFIYISHNKVAMEMASHLAGVTMQEAGVSRLVAVDVEQAVAMTESA